MKYRAAMISLAVAIALLAIFVALGGRKEATPVPVPAPVAATDVAEQMRDAIRMPVDEETPASEPATPEPQLAPMLQLARGKLPWEETIKSVTGAGDLSETAKARRLLSLIPSLPENGLAAAAEEAVNRLPDADYNEVALPLVANPQTHGSVESVLFANLMERPDAIALPALLRIAQTPNHPYAKFAHENLDLLLGEDFGADWVKWDAAVRKTLASEAK